MIVQNCVKTIDEIFAVRTWSNVYIFDSKHYIVTYFTHSLKFWLIWSAHQRLLIKWHTSTYKQIIIISNVIGGQNPKNRHRIRSVSICVTKYQCLSVCIYVVIIVAVLCFAIATASIVFLPIILLCYVTFPFLLSLI